MIPGAHNANVTFFVHTLLHFNTLPRQRLFLLAVLPGSKYSVISLPEG